MSVVYAETIMTIAECGVRNTKEERMDFTMNKRAPIITLVVFFLLPGIAVASLVDGFMDNGNGTVTAATTGLMWQQCSAGQSGPGCATGAAVTYTWDAAIAYCEDLSFGGFTDWRLPNIKEFRSIVDSTIAIPIGGPAINTTYFPATQSAVYWSSTTYAPGTAFAWLVGFGDGYVGGNSKTSNYYVRCVR